MPLRTGDIVFMKLRGNFAKIKGFNNDATVIVAPDGADLVTAIEPDNLRRATAKEVAARARRYNRPLPPPSK